MNEFVARTDVQLDVEAAHNLGNQSEAQLKLENEKVEPSAEVDAISPSSASTCSTWVASPSSLSLRMTFSTETCEENSTEAAEGAVSDEGHPSVEGEGGSLKGLTWQRKKWIEETLLSKAASDCTSMLKDEPTAGKSSALTAERRRWIETTLLTNHKSTQNSQPPKQLDVDLDLQGIASSQIKWIEETLLSDRASRPELNPLVSLPALSPSASPIVSPRLTVAQRREWLSEATRSRTPADLEREVRLEHHARMQSKLHRPSQPAITSLADAPNDVQTDLPTDASIETATEDSPLEELPSQPMDPSEIYSLQLVDKQHHESSNSNNEKQSDSAVHNAPNPAAFELGETSPQLKQEEILMILHQPVEIQEMPVPSNTSKTKTSSFIRWGKNKPQQKQKQKHPQKQPHQPEIPQTEIKQPEEQQQQSQHTQQHPSASNKKKFFSKFTQLFSPPKNKSTLCEI